MSRDTRALLRSVERSERRSSLFWWFVEHHDELVTASRHCRVDWIGFCAKAASLGLTDTRGKAPSERNARETWRQARKAVEDARAPQATGARPRRVGVIPPAHMAKDWRPSGFRLPAQPDGQATGNALARPSASTPARAAGDAPLSRYARPEDTPEMKAAFADIEEQLGKQDWWLFGGPSKQRRRD